MNPGVQNGDLEASFPERLIIVLEGVLALVVQERQHTGRFRRTDTITYHIMWHEVPIKRFIVTKERYPHYELEIVTFLGESLADQAAQYLQRMNVPYDSINYESIDDFVMMLPYQRNVRAVYDSDPENLHRFGQVGVAVVRGEDW